MIAGGFVTAVSALAVRRATPFHTIGSAFDMLPAVLFLHVFLAFPDGRLRSLRARLVARLLAAIGLQLAQDAARRLRPAQSARVSHAPGRGADGGDRFSSSAQRVCLVGVGVLAARRRRAGRPLRRSVALVIDSFALGLVMLAVLFVVAAFEGPAFVESSARRFVMLGISPDRLPDRAPRRAAGALGGRRAVGRAARRTRRRRALRDALARALRDPSLALVYWLPEFES